MDARQIRNGVGLCQRLLLAALLVGAFTRLATAGASITYDPGDDSKLGDPQGVYDFSQYGTGNNSPMPAMPGSLFPAVADGTTGNEVTVNTGSRIAGHVFGAIADDYYSKEAATNNKVIIHGSTIGSTSKGGNVTGGWALDGPITGNTVTIAGDSTIYGIVFGGWIRGAGGGLGQNGSNATGNGVTITAGTFKGNVYGSYVQTGGGKLEGNTVEIENGTFANTGGFISGGYSGIATNEVTDNHVTITGGTFTGARATSVGYEISGGKGQNSSDITSNTVTINGATLTNTTVYGGQNSYGSGKVTGNEVEIGNDTSAQQTRFTNGTIYGGYSDSGVATGNKVTLGENTAGNFAVVAGGFSKSGKDAFTSNILELNSDATITKAMNFREVTFGTNATTVNIGTLSTDAVGSGQSGVIMDTAGTDVLFNNGVITGSGDLTKEGSGTLILNRDGSAITHPSGVTITAGSLQLGTGDTGGSIATEKFTLAAGTSLIFNQSDSVEANHYITGAGKIVQSGTGTLTVRNTAAPGADTFTGGTEIESGTLSIVDDHSLNVAQDATAGSKAGFVTFTGGDANGPKRIEIAAPLELSNSFRTADNVGNENYISFSAPAVIRGVTIASDGGAFYVGEDTTLNVSASSLMLYGNTTSGDGNDLFVDDNATFNLTTDYFTTFESGIAGTGTLNLTGGSAPATASSPFATVYLLDRVIDPGTPTYSMGSTKLDGSSGRPITLDIVRENPTLDRVTLTNNGSFEVVGSGPGEYSAALRGDGIVTADEITVQNGGVLLPYQYDAAATSSTAHGTPGTLTLESDTISLTDFGMVYGVNKVPDETQNELDADDDTFTSNNSLLYLKTGATNRATLDNGLISIVTLGGGGRFEEGQYLIIKSDGGFKDRDGNALDNSSSNNNVNKHLSLRMGSGIVVDQGQQIGPRGNFDGFFVGGDPLRDSTTAEDFANTNIDSGDTNIWLTHGLNSLSMELNSDVTGGEIVWNAPGEFESLQTESNVHATQVWDNDKIYLTGNSAVTVNLPTANTRDLTSSNYVVTSGLVVGQNIQNSSEVYDTADYTVAGGGGVTAYVHGAFGEYVNSHNPDELVPTGKLQKYGEGTLNFTNTGGNYFEQGIELHGGKTRFNRGDQLLVGTDGKIVFQPHLESQKAVLEATTDVTLATDTAIASGFTGGLSAVPDATFVYSGRMTAADASAVFEKSGAGKVVLTGDSSGVFRGGMNVAAGTLKITGDYRGAASFDVSSGSTLTGTGWLGGVGTVSGTVMPGERDLPGGFDPASFVPLSVNMRASETLTFASGSRFAVRVTDNNTDILAITDGGVSVQNGATVLANFDFARMNSLTNGSYYQIIDDMAGVLDDDIGIFTVSHNLPRGWDVRDEWDMKLANGVSKWGNWLVLNWLGGFGKIPDGSHNENEIGKIVDIINHDQPPLPPPLHDLVNRVVDVDNAARDDDLARRMMRQLDGDLAANAFFLAFKEPWRHPFNRLTFADPFCVDVNGRPFLSGAGPRIWAEFTTRYESTRDDGNAFGFRVRRHGLALGLDRAFSPGFVAGLTFQYSRPELRQATGTARADDFEFGLYGLARLPGAFEAKGYLGYSRQSYDFKRSVSLPAASPDYPNPLYEQLAGSSGGHALSASFELSRPFDVGGGVRLMPSAAADYEKVWLDGYTESGGAAALRYADSSAERLTFRAGATGEYRFRDRHALKARAQYGHHFLGDGQPSVVAGFALADGALPTARILGTRLGRDYLNLGVGAEFRMGRCDNVNLYVNYDAKFYRRGTTHAGEAGVSVAF